MVNLETAWPNGQPWPRRRLGALPRCNWQGFKVTKPSSTSTEMSRRRANRSQSRFYQKNDKLSFIFINHDLSIDLVSLVPAKQFAPVVVLKAGLVRFPMLSPPADSTDWGHLRKNVPGQCRKRAEFLVRDSLFGKHSRFHLSWSFTVSPPMIFHENSHDLRGRQRFEVGENTCHGLWFRYCWLQAMGVTWAATREEELAQKTKTGESDKGDWWIHYGYLWIFMDIYGYYYGNLHVLLLWGLGSWMFLR